nr:hypothetical protein [Tanacetum cinerariifolium]
MSDSEHSSVTYTSVSSPVEDYSDIGSPEVDGPPSQDYVPGPKEPEQAPLSPNYVPGSEEPEQAPLSLNYVHVLEEPEQAPLSPDYMPGLEEPDRGAAIACYCHTTADSPGYIREFDPNGDPKEDDEEDPEEDPTDYPVDSKVVALLAVDHVPFEERLRFASLTPSQEARESSAADIAPGRPMSKELGYGITDTWDELVGASEEIAPTILQGFNQRVTYSSTVVEQETTIMYGMMEEAQDDRSQLRGRVNLLYRDRPVHCHLAVMIERERG